MRQLSLLFVLLAGGLWTGCAHFEPAPVSPARAAADFQERSLADPALKAFLETHLHTNLSAWPIASWDFTNLTLAAFYYSPELDVARAKWAVARAGKITAGERPNPTVSMLPTLSTTTRIPSPWVMTPTLDIPIETAGKRGYRIAEASELSEAARLNIATAGWQVRSSVRRSLLDVYSAQQTKALMEEQQVIQSENITLLQRQFDAGEISAFELAQARLANDSARLAVHDAVAQAADARLQLANIVGVPSPALESARLSLEIFGQLPGEVSVAQARREALLNRADILSALSEYAASQASLQSEIAKQYPDIHLDPGYEFDQGNSKWTIGVSLTLPVLNQNQGAIAEAQARRVESAANFNLVQTRALADIDRAYAAWQIALQKRAAAAALLADSRKQERTSQAMFDAGEISKTELAALRLQLAANALSNLDAVVKAQQALGQLEDALQSPLGYSDSLWQTSPRVAGPPTSNQRP